MPTQSLRLGTLIALAAVSAVCTLTRPARAQVTESNEFLQLIAQQGTAATVAADEGRFQLRTTGGDPDVVTDDNADFTYPTSFTSYTSLHVETDRAGTVTTTPVEFRFNARPVKSTDGVIDASMLVDITASNGIGGGVGQTNDFEWRQVLTLARHTLEIRYELKNLSSVTHRVGLRVMIDTQLGATDGAEFMLPVLGRIINETEFVTPDVPREWIAADNFSSPTAMSQGILQGSEATTPDRFQFAQYTTINPVLYNYQINASRRVVGDSAVALYWNPASIRPLETKTFVTYYGLGYASAEFSQPFVLATTSPFSLRYAKSDDLNTPETEATLNPNPFDVSAFFFNRSPRQITGATVSLQLPTGFELATNESLVKALGNIDPRKEGTATWSVRATGAAAGKLAFTVTGAGLAASAKTVSREINVPHLPFGFSLTAATQMISFPFQFVDPDPAQALGLAPSEFQLARYNTRDRVYDFYPASLTNTRLQPGLGFWVQAATNTNISLRGADILTVADHAVDLFNGWNQIGNPFPIGIYLGSLQVLVDGQRLDWDTAIALGYIRGTLFTWDTERQPPEYAFSFDPEFLIQPLKGFWLRALKDCTLLMPSAQVIGAIRSRSEPEPLGGWRLQVSATGGGLRDSQNFLGAAPGAADLFRAREDVEEPPPFSPYLSVRFPHDDWGDAGRNFAQDVRASLAGAETWDMEVATDLPEEDVTLTWPNLSDVPNTIRLTLTDLTTGESVYLRTHGSYPFRSGAGPSVRRFRVTASNAASAALRITNFQVLPGRAAGGQTFSFALSQPAEVRMTVRSGNGRVVHQQSMPQSRAAGLNVLEWNGRSALGQPVPRGVYVAELVARTEDGQSARALRPLSVR